MDLIKQIARLLWVNVLWLISSIPLITLGAATCAAFAVTLRLADDDEEVQSFGGIARRFFKAFKQDLLQGFLLEVVTLAGLGLGGLFVYLAWDSDLTLVKIVLLVVYFLVLFVVLFYAYPLVARYTNTFANTLKNSIALFAQYPNSSVKTLGLVILETAVLALSYKIYCAGLIILPAVIFYTISRTAKDIFFKLENPEAIEDSEPAENQDISENTDSSE